MNPKVRVVAITVPDDLLDKIDRLVKEGKYASRSDLIRVACRELLKKWNIE